MSTVIRSKTYFPYSPEIPGTPLIEPCEEFPYGVPEVPGIAEVIEHWSVDCYGDGNPPFISGHNGLEWVPLGPDATDEEICAYIDNAYGQVVYTPPEES